jgi:hypothetical protein
MSKLSFFALVWLAAAPACSSSKPSADTTATVAPAAAAVGSVAAGSAATQAPVPSTETAVAPEVNPPGDIPDSQAFVRYASTAGNYSFEVPEGWARTETGPNVSFVSKLDGVKVDVAPAAAAPTVASARAGHAAQLQAQGHAVTITNVSSVTLPSGNAVMIKYASNSEPNAVTHKQVRLENEAYLIYGKGTLATLTFWAPQGADNVDQWNRMSKSFQWK